MGAVLVCGEGADKGSPLIEAYFACHDEFYRTVETCARIPARTLFYVQQIHVELVFAWFHKGCDIHAEGIIAVGPVASLLAIDTYRRL